MQEHLKNKFLNLCNSARPSGIPMLLHASTSLFALLGNQGNYLLVVIRIFILFLLFMLGGIKKQSTLI